MSKFVHTVNGPWLRADLIKEIHCRNGAYIAVCEDGESRQLCPAFEPNALVFDPSPVVPAIAKVTVHCLTWDDEQDQPYTWKTSVVAWQITDDGPFPILLDGSTFAFGAIESQGRFVIPCSGGEVYDTLEQVIERYKELHQRRRQPDPEAKDAAEGDDPELAGRNDDNVCAFPSSQTQKPGRTVH